MKKISIFIMSLVFLFVLIGCENKQKNMPETVSDIIERGNYYFSNKMYQEAISEFTEAIRLDPGNANTYSNLGNVYDSMGNYDMAVTFFLEALKLNPDLDEAHSGFGSVYFQVWKNNSGNAESLADSGELWYNKTIADYTEEISLNPNNIAAFFSRGYTYGFRSDYVNAIADFSEAIRLDTNNTVLYYYRGNIYQLIDYDKAISDYTAALVLKPDFYGALSSRGLLYMEMSDFFKVIEDYSKLIRLNNRNAGNYIARGQAYEAIGDYNKAIDDFETALQFKPNDFWLKKELEEIRKMQK